jgi:hypothetical protein
MELGKRYINYSEGSARGVYITAPNLPYTENGLIVLRIFKDEW